MPRFKLLFIVSFLYLGTLTYAYLPHTFTYLSHINDGGTALGVAVAADGTVFLANESLGLFAYTYSGFVGINEIVTLVADHYSLSQNYPNPFNMITTIAYSLPRQSHVFLNIYNILGEKVAELVNEYKDAGFYSIHFNANNFPSGIYLYQIKAAEFSKSRKMMLMK